MSTAPLEQQQRYYDDLWSQRGAWRGSHELLRLGRILATTATLVEGRPEGSLRICDLGCGTGWLAAELCKLGAVTGYDLSEQAIELARRSHPGIEFESGNLFEISTDRPFDLVVSSEVIEHVDDQAGFIEVAARLLAPGGHLLLTCPNGRVKPWVDIPAPQPLERWPTPAKLASLVRRRFEILDHDTLLFGAVRRGPFSVLAASRLTRALRPVGLGSLPAWVQARLRLGLYQIVFARKR